MMSEGDKKTPLYEAHRSLGAKIASFHGWLLPIQYTGIIDEHKATRARAGLFDISHLGKIVVSGGGSFEFLQRVFTNDISGCAARRIVYSPFCDETGGILDDVFIYNTEKDKYILVVNAATVARDLEWFARHNKKRAEIRDITEAFGGIAIQGPNSLEILARICDADLNAMSHRQFCEAKVSGLKSLLSRSGYTGEDGFEIFMESANAARIWEDLLKFGRPLGLLPAGLGARDVLRLEAGCSLYGVDVDETKTPLEARLEKAVDFKKDFIGKDAILRRRAGGITQVLAGFKMLDKAIARRGCPIMKAGRATGVVTSGTHSPSLKENIGFGYVDNENSAPGSGLEIVIHGGSKRAEVVNLPFYKSQKRPSLMER